MTSPGFVGLSELRSELIGLLKSSRSLLEGAGGPLDRADHYRGLASIVENELHKVTQLELRMAIVAPMKAGKSTIVNAILGQSVLPARNSAMTSIPTEIVCENSLTAPLLQLHADTRDRFSEVWQRLHRDVRRRGLEEAVRDTAEYPELSVLIRNLAKKPRLSLKENVRGVGEVQQVLLLLNDLCRLAPVLVSGLSPIAADKAFRVPRLLVPFLRVDPGAQAAGRLVIVDTPGPNEARHHERLERIVSDELKSTSVVLLILDFSQLNTQAAELVSRDVQRVAAIVGEENLFVLINKIDERDEKSMTTNEVRQFVTSHLRLKGPVAANRIFEISAKRALCAANFLRELRGLGDQPKDASIRALPSANELAAQVYGPVSWEDDLAEATGKQLAKRAQRLWELSQFEPFLSNAIETVMADVAPLCLSIALKVVRTHLATLRNDTKLRRKGIAAVAAELTREIDQLGAEMDNLERARRTIDGRLRAMQDELRRHLDWMRRGLQISATVDVDDFFRHVERGESFFGWVKQLAKDAKRHLWVFGEEEPRIASFANEQQAAEFARLAFQYAMDRVRPRIEESLARVSRRVEGVRFDVEEMIVNETRPILARAAERLRKQFDVHLIIPPPDLGNPLEVATAPDRLVKHVEGGYRIEMRRVRPWWLLWLFEIERPVKVKKKDRIVVSLEEVAHDVNDTIRQSLERTAHRFDEFVEGEFKEQIDEYFRSLVKYLSFYQESLQNAHAAQQMSLAEREAVGQRLDAIAKESDALMAAINSMQDALSNDTTTGNSARSVPSMLDTPIDVFFSYSHSDEPLRKELEQHVSSLRRDGIIRAWHDREISAGDDWKGAIDEHLERAKIIVLLVSSDFLGSDYCYDIEMKRALERHADGGACVVPVILRPCDWRNAPFAKFEVLPKGGEPIKSWADQDKAFLNVAQGIRHVAEGIRVGCRAEPV